MAQANATVTVMDHSTMNVKTEMVGWKNVSVDLVLVDNCVTAVILIFGDFKKYLKEILDVNVSSKETCRSSIARGSKF